MAIQLSLFLGNLIRMEIQLGKHLVGEGHKTFIIAEMSGNHGGNIETALEIVRAAKEVGADAVKLQTYRPDTITLNSKKKDFLLPKDNPWSDSKNLYSLYEKAFTPWEWHKAIFEEAHRIGLTVFSSPFDCSAVDLLEDLNTPFYKIASPEITDIPLLEYVASKGKPVIISTGVAELEDIQLATKTLKEGGVKDIIILKCTSSYPAPPQSINLRTMVDMASRFNCLVGLSDHTLGTSVPVAAAVLGASVIEKHFILKKTDQSVDGFFSLDREEFKQMVEDVRTAELALGQVSYQLDDEGKKNFWGRRSLYVSKDISAGEKITSEHIKSVRPYFGLHPKFLRDILGKTACRNLEYGDRVQLEDFK